MSRQYWLNEIDYDLLGFARTQIEFELKLDCNCFISKVRELKSFEQTK